MTKLSLIPVLGLAAVLAGCQKKEAPPVYQLTPISTRDIVVSVNANGNIQPQDSVEIKSKASGEITEIRVQTGDLVKKGQLLVRVDQRLPKATLEQAKADLEVARAQEGNAQSQLKRAQELYQTKAITEQEYETAKLSAATAKAAVVRAQTNLDNATISFQDTDVRAPRDGVVLTKNVDVGSVIQSATGGVSGGQVLMKMANLDTVQVRAMVDETDIGKLSAGLDVSITVSAFPSRRFTGQVQKIEPQSVVQQNVTMFPVTVRLPNPDRLLRPGMNAEIAITVGERRGVPAVPNAALRTTRDVASAAGVLGLTMDEVTNQLAAAAETAKGGQASLGGTAKAGDAKPGAPEKYTTSDGREVTLPPGLTAKRLDEVMAKMRSGGFQTMSEEDREVMQQYRQVAGGGRGGNGAGQRPGGGGGGANFGGGFVMIMGGPGEGGPARRPRPNNFQSGGDYIVFVMRNGQPTAVNVRTGLTDLEYAEIVNGLTPKDTVLLLPSASLVASQDQFKQMMQSRSGLPGVTSTPTGGRGR